MIDLRLQKRLTLCVTAAACKIYNTPESYVFPIMLMMGVCVFLSAIF